MCPISGITGSARKLRCVKDRRIKRIFQNYPWKSATRIIAHISEIMVSPRTIQRSLVNIKLFSRCQAKISLISDRNRRARLEFVF